jgi:hypothetical protein
MPELESWLQKHELSSIAELLRSHDITFDVLPDLTDQDLREIGLSLGLRRKLECNPGRIGRPQSARHPRRPQIVLQHRTADSLRWCSWIWWVLLPCHEGSRESARLGQLFLTAKEMGIRSTALRNTTHWQGALK